MIALAAHLIIMQDHTWPRGVEDAIPPKRPYIRGGCQSPSKWTCVRRYKARQRGIEPPLEYGSLDKALDALS